MHYAVHWTRDMIAVSKLVIIKRWKFSDWLPGNEEHEQNWAAFLLTRPRLQTRSDKNCCILELEPTFHLVKTDIFSQLEIFLSMLKDWKWQNPPIDIWHITDQKLWPPHMKGDTLKTNKYCDESFSDDLIMGGSSLTLKIVFSKIIQKQFCFLIVDFHYYRHCLCL